MVLPIKFARVVSAGRMARTVRVSLQTQTYDSFLQKFYPSSVSHLVHDPNNSLIEGDVIRIIGGHRVAKHVKHVVTEIVVPFGKPIEERPPVLSLEELKQIADEKREARRIRKAEASGKEIGEKKKYVGKINTRIMENKRKTIERYQMALGNRQALGPVKEELKRMGLEGMDLKQELKELRR
ncbi:MAG: hypothetical protein M1834_001333 [Cirrosporium novae-zelandiae]|nr:MAG: hypothetical protein M1834_001333 [Cirrosporium novae-zelandiae]